MMALGVGRLACIGTGMVLCLGTGPGQAPLKVKDSNGRWQQPLAARTNPTALVFITTECPIANAYAPEINRIIAAYEPKGVRFYLVQVAPDVTAAQAKKHAEEYGYKPLVLLDPKGVLVKATGALVTPEAVVLLAGRVVYKGRIDDLYYGLGKRRARVTQRDLRLALDAALRGRKPVSPAAPAIGCTIPRL